MSEAFTRGPRAARDDASRPPLRALLLAGGVAVLLQLVASAIAWSHVPQRMAVHFSGDSPDRYAGRTFGLLAMPVTTAALTLLIVAANAAEPYPRNLSRSSRALVPIWIVVMAVLSIVHLFMIMTAIRPAPKPGVVGAVLIGLLMVVIGHLLPKARPNWTFGVRTPWTLTSSLSWYRTHRLGGVLFLLAGLVGLGVGVGQVPEALEVTVGLSILVAVVLVAYSWWVWRGDPDRRTNLA